MRRRVLEVVGVYDAKGSVAGELAYVFGKLVGRRHCALCDITHGALRRRRSFDAVTESLDVPFDLRHLDELTPDIAEAVAGRPPRVFGRTSDGLVLLADADELEGCGSEPTALLALLQRNAERLSLDLTVTTGP